MTAPDTDRGPSAVAPVPILGLEVARLREAEAAAVVVDRAAAGRGCWMVTANLDHLRRYRRERSSRELIDRADLVVADGAPLVWASRLAGDPLPERVAGSSMVWRIAELAARRGTSVFLLGGNPGTAERAARVLCERFPGLEVAGVLCPAFGFERDEGERAAVERRVVAAGPGIVLVGLGFPKQDLLIKRLRTSLSGASFVGVGVSFSFLAGEVDRAPELVQKLGLEWLYRLVQEPSRLARRYLLDGLPFALVLMAAALRTRLSRATSRSPGA